MVQDEVPVALEDGATVRPPPLRVRRPNRNVLPLLVRLQEAPKVEPVAPPPVVLERIQDEVAVALHREPVSPGVRPSIGLENVTHREPGSRSTDPSTASRGSGQRPRRTLWLTSKPRRPSGGPRAAIGINPEVAGPDAVGRPDDQAPRVVDHEVPVPLHLSRGTRSYALRCSTPTAPRPGCTGQGCSHPGSGARNSPTDPRSTGCSRVSAPGSAARSESVPCSRPRP